MRKTRQMMPVNRKFTFLVSALLSLLILFPGILAAQESTGSVSLRLKPISQVPAASAPVLAANESPGSLPAGIAESLRERIKNMRPTGTGASKPLNPDQTGPGSIPGLKERIQAIRSSRDQLVEAQNLSGTNHKSKASARSGRIRDEVKVWLRPVAGTPRQIKVRDAARRRGVALGYASSTLGPGRERDEQTARAFLNSHRTLLRISHPDDELNLSRYRKDRLGRRHLRYAQKYKGLPVWPAELIVHLDQTGNADLMNGVFVSTPRRLVTKPVWSADEAVERARAEVPGGHTAVAGDPLLIVYAPGDRAARLAWKVEVPVSAVSNWLVVIDALNGVVLTAYDQVPKENVSGSGVDLFGKTRQLNLWHENNQYFMVNTSKQMYDPASAALDPSKTKGSIMVLDMANSEVSDDGNIQYRQVVSQNSTSEWLPEGVSMAYSLSEIYDYFLERHGRNSFDGNGGRFIAFVRRGQNWDNACWSPGFKAMFYGDAKPYAGALDVIAHELTHGVTSETCNLVYRDQQGALNEAFSDIFGSMVEARTDGSTDWIHGTVYGGDRSMKDPAAFKITPNSNYYYPTKMSEFYGRNHPLLQQFVNQDNGGVHVNNMIVSHAFYLLAEGLDGAIGLQDAASIFHRAQTVHLVASSQFIDARLACIVSAEELFGAGSAQALKTAAAFDAVEIFDDAATPQPPPTPPVSGTDSAVFVYYDPDYFGYYLGGYEQAFGGANPLSCFPVAQARPSVTGDGSLAFFVDETNDACFISTDPTAGACEDCLGFPGEISSVAMSPDGQVYAFVLLDEQGEPTDSITVVDLRPGGQTRTFQLVSPTDAENISAVEHADSMDFYSDNSHLVYDAYNVLHQQDGTKIGVWSIYAIDLETEQTLTVITPNVEADVGYPALSRTTNHMITFDVLDASSGNSTILALNLITGNGAQVGTVPGTWGVPGYTGDDGAIVYSYPDNNTYTGMSAKKQPLAQDGITPQGDPSAVFSTGDYGNDFLTVYRRGTFVAPVPNISVSPASVASGEVSVGSTKKNSVAITNTGSADLGISGVSIAGENASEFSLSGTCSGQTLPASGTCTLNVAFSPSSAGAKSAALSIQSNDPDTPLIEVQLRGTGKITSRYTITVSQDGNGTIDPDGVVTLDAGSNQAFGFTAGSGHHIADVIVNGTSVGAVAAHTVENISANITLHVVFAADVIIRHQITVTKEGAGNVVPGGIFTVEAGSSRSFSFTPAQDFHLADVWVNGNSVGNDATYLLSNITEDTTVHAIFEADPIGDVNKDSTIDLKDTMLVLQILVGLKGNNPEVGGDLDGDSRIGLAEAVHALQQRRSAQQFTYIITASSGNNGSISPKGEVKANPGGQLGFIMTPENGYRVSDVEIDGTSIGPVRTYAFKDIRADASIRVTFAQDQQTPVQHTITATAGANGSIFPADTVTVTENGSQKFTMTPAAGYHVLDVDINGQSIGAQNSYTFVGVTQDATIHVTFARDQQVPQHTITVTADAHAVIEPNGAVLVGHGQNKPFTISALEGFFLKDVLVDGVSKGPLTQFTFTNVTADHTLSVQTANQAPTGTLESEPNNTPAAAQYLGEIAAGNKITVGGKLTSGGISGDTYTGDVDFYRLKLTSVSNLTSFLDWTGNADVDLAVVVWDETLVSVNGAEKPIQTAGALSPEDFLIAIGSKTGAADYSFTLQSVAVNPYYPNNNAILNGKYTRASQTLLPNGGVIIFMSSYIFDGVSKWQSCNWTETSGEACYEYGNYKIWYPFIVLEHTESGSDGKIEVLTLDFDSETQIYIDNQSYPKE